MTLVPHAITVSRIIAAPPVAIYAPWTEPDLMRRWFATVVDADVRVGGGTGPSCTRTTAASTAPPAST
jgi:uncharacterized protein YndB with AHSA1/START domain